jgi:hypothetical protein
MISPTQRPVPDNTQHSQERNIHAVGGIRTRNPYTREAQSHALDRATTSIGQQNHVHKTLRRNYELLLSVFFFFLIFRGTVSLTQENHQFNYN